MKKYKIYVSAILALILVFGNITTCYCIESLEILESLGTVYSAVEASNSAESKRQAVSNWIHKNSEAVGFIFDATSVTLPPALWYLLPESVQNELGENASDDDIVDACRTFILNNQTVSDNSVTDSSLLKDGIVNFINNYVDENRRYCYSLSLRECSSLLNANQYLLAQELMSGDMSGSDSSIVNSVWMLQVPSSGYTYLAQISLNDYPYFTFKNGFSNAQITETGLMYVIPFDGFTGSAITNYSNCYKWINNEWQQQESAYFNTNTSRAVKLEPSSTRGSNRVIFINLQSTQYRLLPFGSASAEDVLYQPYYFNNDVYTDFSTSSGDYVIDSSSVNTVSYGDTISYIDSFNTENGYPPTTVQVNLNIERENTENKTPSSGGDNGGDNGGGSGGDNGGGSSGSNIFDFLSDIGAVLGNLIKNLGNVLTELISGVAEIITGLFEAIPTIFGDFLGALLGWLPEEIRALIILGITAMIIVGIIKVIRG